MLIKWRLSYEQVYSPVSKAPRFLHLLPFTRSSSATVSNKRVSKRKFIPPALSTIHTNLEVLSLGATLQVARELIRAHTLNLDQAAALTQIAHMMASHDSAEDTSGPPTRVPPITVIQGEKRGGGFVGVCHSLTSHFGNSADRPHWVGTVRTAVQWRHLLGWARPAVKPLVSSSSILHGALHTCLLLAPPLSLPAPHLTSSPSPHLLARHHNPS